MVITRDISEEIKSAVNQAVSQFIKSQTFIVEISKKVTDAIVDLLETRFRNIEDSVAALKHDNYKLENKIEVIQEKFSEADKNNLRVEEKLDKMDQASRSCNLRLFNVKEKPSENTKLEIKDLLNAKMSITLTDEDFLLCYRIGKKQENKHRGVFLKLKDMNTKQSIFTKKKLLKGTGIVVREDLTNTRLNIMSKAIEKLGLKQVWSENGKVCLNINGNLHNIVSEKDFTDIFP